jgi:ubiquinone/menaquinone biosynthesis C-methylase UbiE
VKNNSKDISVIFEEWYNKLIENERNDIYLYKKILSDCKGPFLEVFCGSGRILTELLKDGFVVDGLDSSSEILNECRLKVDNLGLKTNLFNQNPEKINLIQNYNTIFITGGSFLLIDNIEDAFNTLKKIYQNLNNGGKFITDIFTPWEQILNQHDNLWRIGKYAENIETNEKFIVFFSNEFDFKNQLRIIHSKFEFYNSGILTQTNFESIKQKWYSNTEFSMMLEKAGFSKIEMQDVKVFKNHGESTLFIASKLE